MKKNRFELKKEANHEELIRSGLKLVETTGADLLHLDLVAERANCSRATLFNHFHSREVLLEAILLPVIEEGITWIIEITDKGTPTFKDISRLCYKLWLNHSDKIYLANCRKTLADNPLLTEKHDQFVRLFLGLFQSLKKQKQLRLENPEASARMAFRCFGSILDSLPADDSTEVLFHQCLKGLLFNLEV